MTQVRVNFKVPISESGVATIENAQGFQMVNRGNTIITLDDGKWTLEPGNSWGLDFEDRMINQTFNVSFGTVNVVDANPVITKLEYLTFVDVKLKC